MLEVGPPVGPTPRLPNFVIIGAQKSGTTTIEGWLDQHPDIWLPDTEDAYFRDPVYGRRSLDSLAKKYAARAEFTLGLKCPDYLGRPEVPVRLAQDLNMPRLIVSLRDPVKRAVSAYFWNMRWGTIPVAPLNVGLRRILDGRSESDLPHAREVLDWGLYARHLRNYLRVFPRNLVHVVVDDDLRFEPAKSLRDIAEFLNVDPDLTPRSTTTRSRNEGVYSLARLRFLQIRRPVVLSIDEPTGYATIEKSRNPLIRGFTNSVVALDQAVLRRVFDNEPPRLDEDLEYELRKFYDSDTKSLQELIGRDLSGWLR